MNLESVKTLFQLFSGEEPNEKYAPVITLAMTEVTRLLRPDADASDVRLDFLAAAFANYRVRTILCSAQSDKVTYAGKLVTPENDSSLAYAEKLLRDHCELCSDLIYPYSFIFIGVSGGERL